MLQYATFRAFNENVSKKSLLGIKKIKNLKIYLKKSNKFILILKSDFLLQTKPLNITLHHSADDSIIIKYLTCMHALSRSHQIKLSSLK